MTDLFHLFQSSGQPVKPFVRLQKKFPRAKVLNVRLPKRSDSLDVFLSCAIFMALKSLVIFGIDIFTLMVFISISEFFLPPQGFRPEAKSRGGTLVARAWY